MEKRGVTNRTKDLTSQDHEGTAMTAALKEMKRPPDIVQLLLRVPHPEDDVDGEAGRRRLRRRRRLFDAGAVEVVVVGLVVALVVVAAARVVLVGRPNPVSRVGPMQSTGLTSAPVGPGFHGWVIETQINKA